MKLEGYLTFENAVVMRVVDIDPGSQFRRPKVLVRIRLANELEQDYWLDVGDEFKGRINVDMAG